MKTSFVNFVNIYLLMKEDSRY